MNIENIDNSFEKKEYAGSIRRSFAATIDIWIVLITRIIIMQLLGMIWINKQMAFFMQEFREHFGTEFIKNNPEHIDFIIHHRMFYYALVFYAIVIFIGTLYHAYLNSSAWQATIGKRLMKIIIVTQDGEKISLNRGRAHYFLSILPFAFIIYLISYQLNNGLTLFQTVTHSETNVFLGISFILWTQIHMFTKKKTTAYDIICKTVLIKKRTDAKFPWTKKTQ